MKAIFITNPLPGRDFDSELRFPLIAASFFKKAYPGSECVLASSGKIPKYFSEVFTTINFPFNEGPLALMRSIFWREYVRSSLFNDTTFFIGHDVIVLDRFPSFSEFAVMTNYRYHPSQPFCSDFIAVNPSKKRAVQKIFDEALTVHRWMPKNILDGAADQLSWANILGVPETDLFDGHPIVPPRKGDVVALPVDPFFFTPNDAFPVKACEFTGRTRGDYVLTEELMREYMSSKHSLHFKGPRKQDMIKFARWAWKNGDIKINTLNYSAEEFFKI
jgi:hypothetical protein